jgi:hypothetical protein
MLSSYSNIIEDAETHTAVTFGVMSGWSQQGIGILYSWICLIIANSFNSGYASTSCIAGYIKTSYTKRCCFTTIATCLIF